jgi:hypothetical protein
VKDAVSMRTLLGTMTQRPVAMESLAKTGSRRLYLATRLTCCFSQSQHGAGRSRAAVCVASVVLLGGGGCRRAALTQRS